MTTEPPYTDVLVPTDGSDAAATAAEHALDVAAQHGATVHVLYVVDSRITMAADEDTRDALRDQLEREGATAIERIRELAAGTDVELTDHITRGTPWKEILAFAEDAPVDLIVMGSTGKSPREKRVGMGSVSERVVDDATVPVLVVPD